MSTATRWYATREAVKAAVGIDGAKSDALIAAKIEAATADVERLMRPRIFIPETTTKYFDWPQRSRGRSGSLYLDDLDLLAVTLLQTQAQDGSPVTIAPADYYLEPANRPPFKRIDIDRASSAAFATGISAQRSIGVTGRWAFSEDTAAAGALAEAVDGSETELQVTDASLIGVGDTLLIGTEALFVSEKGLLDTSADLNDTLTADLKDQTVTVSDGTKVHQGEVIQLESEQMLVRSIAGNDLSVDRAYNGTTLAAHSTGINVYALRSLTVVRGVNGTTAAAHDTATTIRKYVVPADIVELCIAEAIAHLKQDQSGWTGQISGGEAGQQVRMVDLFFLRKSIKEKYKQVTF